MTLTLLKHIDPDPPNGLKRIGNNRRCPASARAPSIGSTFMHIRRKTFSVSILARALATSSHHPPATTSKIPATAEGAPVTTKYLRSSAMGRPPCPRPRRPPRTRHRKQAFPSSQTRCSCMRTSRFVRNRRSGALHRCGEEEIGQRGNSGFDC